MKIFKGKNQFLDAVKSVKNSADNGQALFTIHFKQKDHQSILSYRSISANSAGALISGMALNHSEGLEIAETMIAEYD